MTKNNLGSKEYIVFALPRYRPITEGSQSRNLSRGHKGVLLAGLLPIACSAGFLIELKTTCPGVAVPQRDKPSPHQLPIKKMHHRFLHRPIYWGVFSVEGSSSKVSPAWATLL